jgi:hypothetical protein
VQGAVVDPEVVAVRGRGAVELVRALVVGETVLGYREHAVRLHALDLRDGDRRVEERILARLVLVAAEVRRPGQLDLRREQHVHAQRAALGAHHLAVLAGELGMERRGQRGHRRQPGRRRGHVDPGRSVREAQLRYAQALYGREVSGLAESLGAGGAVDEGDLLVEGEGGEQFAHAPRGCGGGRRVHGGCGGWRTREAA